MSGEGGSVQELVLPSKLQLPLPGHAYDAQGARDSFFTAACEAPSCRTQQF